MFKKLNSNTAIKYYNYISEKYSDEEIEYRMKKLESVMDPDEYELFIEKNDSQSLNSKKDTVRSSIKNVYQHLFKTLAQPWAVHKSFYKTINDARININRFMNNKNVYNVLTHEDHTSEMNKAYKSAIAEMKKYENGKGDKQGISNLQNRIYNRYDFSNIEKLIFDTVYLRQFIVDVYDELYGLSDVFVVKSLKEFDEFFR